MAAEWKTFPDVIFSEIMTLVGLESLGVLQKCRGVCKTWNVMICQMTRNEKKAIIRKAEDLVAKIQAENFRYYIPLLPEISTIAYLAHQTPQNIPCVQSLRRSVGMLQLQDVDLASVPAKHLASLASCVKIGLRIINVCTTTLVNILDNIKCRDLVFEKQSLGRKETQALVWAMKSRVWNVELFDGVSLDITTLTQYSGHGECKRVWCNGETGDRYREEVKSWGERINWSLNETKRKIQIECPHHALRRRRVRLGVPDPRRSSVQFSSASTLSSTISPPPVEPRPNHTLRRRRDLPKGVPDFIGGPKRFL